MKVLLAALAMLVAVSCVPTGRAGQDSPAAIAAKPAGKPQTGLRTAELRSGSVSIVVELAETAAQQEIGLMHRTELPDSRGMLFVYPDDRRLSFWMKNTLIPLSIAYLASDGTIKEIHDMAPLSLAPVESGRYVRYALEAPQGWFDRVGLRPGDRFDLTGLPSGR
ncbi:MAG: DUF192 domain-containing protein [Spirochaetales bacterium]|nr:DUF192 domain-containing protein [Spirochaetales bacterium]